MTKTFFIAAALGAAFLSSAAASGPKPAPDRAQLERALAAAELRDQRAESPLQKRVEAADRISSTMIRVAPDKLDPNVAAALLR